MKNAWALRQTVFTIVELLIVIVVIAILAAITIVAYNGIQNRANDTVVQADLANYARKAKEFNVLNGRYPNTIGELDSLEMRASQSAYATVQNLVYCRTNDPVAIDFAFVAKSKSGNAFYVSSKGSGTTTIPSAVTGQSSCDPLAITYQAGGGAGTGSVVVGYSAAGVWQGWAQ